MQLKPPGCRLSEDLVAVGLGDRQALQRVYESSSGKLLAICLRITGNRSAAEDVLQETFIKIWNRAAGFEPDRARAIVWLAAIARNSVIDWYRSHHRRSFVGENAILFRPDEAEPVEDRMIREEQESRAVNFLAQLPAQQEAEIRSAFFQGLSYAEVAERDGIPLGTLKSRVRRGLMVLRSKLEND